MDAPRSNAATRPTPGMHISQSSFSSPKASRIVLNRKPGTSSESVASMQAFTMARRSRRPRDPSRGSRNCLIYYVSRFIEDLGHVLSHKHGKRNTHPNTSLLQIEGVSTKEDAQFYLGKRVAYVYRAKREVAGPNICVIWGRVTRPHGNWCSQIKI